MFVLFCPAYRTQILCCCFLPCGCQEDKPEIDDNTFFRPFARLRWLSVLEKKLYCVSHPALHRAAMPNIFRSFFLYFLVCFWWLSTLLTPMCVILVVYYKSCVCYFATLRAPSLTSSQFTIAALSYDFTDEVFTVRL